MSDHAQKAKIDGVGTRPAETRPETRWVVWGRTLLASLVVAALCTLGIANVVTYSRWHEVEDGVLWGARAEGVTALEIAANSAAAQAGVQAGDVLIAVNGVPIA